MVVHVGFRQVSLLSISRSVPRRRCVGFVYASVISIVSLDFMYDSDPMGDRAICVGIGRGAGSVRLGCTISGGISCVSMLNFVVQYGAPYDHVSSVSAPMSCSATRLWYPLCFVLSVDGCTMSILFLPFLSSLAYCAPVWQNAPSMDVCFVRLIMDLPLGVTLSAVAILLDIIWPS